MTDEELRIIEDRAAKAEASEDWDSAEFIAFDDKGPLDVLALVAEVRRRTVALDEALDEMERIKAHLGLRAGGVGLPVSAHVEQLVAETKRLKALNSELAEACAMVKTGIQVQGRPKTGWDNECLAFLEAALAKAAS